MRHLTFAEIDIPTFVPESPEELVTYLFAIDTAYLAESLQSVSLNPATISLGEDLGLTAAEHLKLATGAEAKATWNPF